MAAPTYYHTDLFLEMGVLELPFMTSSIAEHRKAAEALRPFYTEALAPAATASAPSSPRSGAAPSWCTCTNVVQM